VDDLANAAEAVDKKVTTRQWAALRVRGAGVPNASTPSL
jgi:hypothetical protein